MNKPLIALLLAASAHGALSAQDSASPSLRVKSEAVLLDLLVVDRDDNFLDDLKLEEVHLFEDGKPQRIQFFELQRALDQPEDPASPGGPADAASGQAAFGSPRRAAALVFLIDLGSVNHADLVRVKQSVGQFVTERGEGARFMLATTGGGLRVVQDFTSDSAQFLESLESLQVFGDSDSLRLTDLLNTVEHLFNSFASNQNNVRMLMQAANLAADRGVAFVHGIENRLSQATGGLSVMASHLRSLPGRKHIILYSGGYHLDPSYSIREMIRLRLESELFGTLEPEQRAEVASILSRLQRSDLNGYMRAAIDAANRAQVSVYSVDARGLEAGSFDPAHTLRAGSRLAMLGKRASYGSFDVSRTQDFLVGLATSTGGRAFLNSNDLSRGVRRAFEDARRYYLLTYTPTTERVPGKYHRIKVRVDRPGARIVHRNGYLDVPEPQFAQQEVLNALSFPALFRDSGLRLETDFDQDRIRIKTLIPTAALRFAAEGDGFSCPVETYGVLVDERGRWLEKRPMFAKSHQLRLEPNGLRDFRSVDYVSTVSEVPAPGVGRYRLVVVVRQGWAAEIGAVTSEIEIPPPAAQSAVRQTASR